MMGRNVMPDEVRRRQHGAVFGEDSDLRVAKRNLVTTYFDGDGVPDFAIWMG